jgi:hypothetical protein
MRQKSRFRMTMQPIAENLAAVVCGGRETTPGAPQSPASERRTPGTFSEAREMTLGKAECMNEIFRLLCEQRELLNRWAYSSEQIRQDEEISARIDELVDQICAGQSLVKLT